ncbi:cytochrome c biogenesis protein ResB, partial [bacterium]|nr:cytochrome c biogenesis protein ResB [bacterium]
VNEPFSFGGYTFYQSNWSQKHGLLHFTVKVQISSASASAPSEMSYSLVASVGSQIKPDWSPYSFLFTQFFPDFKIVGEGNQREFVSVSNELNNPAALIEAFDEKGQKVGSAWGFQNEAMSNHFSKLPIPHTFVFAFADGAFESGLQAAQDPGAPVVWVGCTLMTLGMVLAFYIKYVEKWVILRPDNRVSVAVMGNRAQFLLKTDFDSLVSSLSPAHPQPGIEEKTEEGSNK